MFKLCLILGISIIIGAEAAIAPFIEPCVWSDKKCIMESSIKALPYFVNGVPDLGIQSADPIYIDDINADSGELKLHFKDLKITGTSKTKFINVERPDPDSTIVLEVELPVTVTGKYKAGGKLIFIDLTGDGDAEIVCDQLSVKINIKLKKFEKNGHRYNKISGYDYTFEPITRVSFKFTNLYEGDEEKAQLLMDLINQNWKDILIGIGKPVIQKIIDEKVSMINKLFKSLPLNEMEKAP